MRENIKKHFGLFLGLSIVLMVFSNFTPANVTAQPDGPVTTVTVEQAILDEMETQGTASYWIKFEDEVDLSPAYDMDWSERGWFVYETLLAQAEKSQSQVRSYLQKTNIGYQSYWINNSILVTSSNNSILNNLTQFAGVKRMEGRKTFFLQEPDRSNAVLENSVNTIEPNLTHINADDVWAMDIDGTGLVVANIDTGVRYSHEALVNQYRGNNDDDTFEHNFNWYDPYNEYTSPYDGHGHGTHTMGTMVGSVGNSNQIGMAPGAEWIACRGCNTSDCGDEELLACGQFMAAPTDLTGANPNPDMRPHVVNNSWGDCGTTYDPWYEGPINAWHAAGTYPIFSNGNAGNCGYSSPPGFNTVGNPARSGNVTGVGSTGLQDGEYAVHSNWGPTDNPDMINPSDGFEELKPQVVAPGVNIRSSVNWSDTAYMYSSGTSMSAPHVSGLVALIWQASPCLIGDYAATENIIEDTAIDIVYDDGSDLTSTNFPNFATGWGEIDALAAVNHALGLSCPVGEISGKVTSDDITPLAGAKIFADNGANLTINIYTAADGTYSANLPIGIYTLTASKYGYSEDIKTEIEVPLVGGTTPLDFTIHPMLSVIPTELEQTQFTNTVTNQSLTILNPSASEIEFELLEYPEDSLLLENVELFLETGDDIPWLSLDPMTGTVSADDSLVITLTFDSSDLAGADYLGSVQIVQAPAPPINVPVTLHITEIRKIYLALIAK